jgi:putative peptidoglycan lipid II flippase
MMALAWALGVSRLADNFLLANVMPNMIYELVIGGILTSILLPVYLEYRASGKTDEAWHVVSSILNITVLILTILAAIGMIFPYVFARSQTLLVPPGQSEIKMLAFFFRFFIPQIIFYGLAGLFSAILNAHRQFTGLAFAPIANNIVVILAVIFIYAPLKNTNPQLALILLAIAVTLGVASMVLVQIPYLIKSRMEYKFVLDYKHPAVKKIAVLSLPIFGYVLLNQIGLTVANNLAYQFKGGVAALQMAWPWFLLFYGIFSVSITTVLFPNLSEHWSGNDIDSFKKDISVGIRSIGFFLIPSTVVLVVLSASILKTVYLFKNGAFNLAAVKMTAPILQAYVLGVFAYGIWVFLTRVFYSFQDTKTPMLVNAIGVPFNIIVDIFLVKLIGVQGIALGLALTYIFTVSTIMFFLRRKIGALNLKSTLFALSKQLMSALFMAAVLAFSSSKITAILGQSTKISQIMTVLPPILFGAIAYLLMAKILGVKEIKFLSDLIKLRRRASASEEPIV